MLTYVFHPDHHVAGPCPVDSWIVAERRGAGRGLPAPIRMGMWDWFDNCEKLLVGPTASFSGETRTTTAAIPSWNRGCQPRGICRAVRCAAPARPRPNSFSRRWKIIESVEEVIRSGKNFVYPIYSKEPPHHAPWNIEWVLKDFSDEMIDAINNGQCNLIIDDSFEGYPWVQEDITEFGNLLMNYNIDVTKVIVLTASWSYVYNSMPFRLVHFPYTECYTRVNSTMANSQLIRKPDAKKFLCLNFNPKLERFEIVYQVHKRGMVGDFNISHNSLTSGAESHRQKNPFGEWDEDRQRFASMLPIHYDITVTDRDDHVLGNPVHHRQENWIYVVTESAFDEGGGYIGFMPSRSSKWLQHMKGGGHRDVSEKTWKPIGLKMPFILLQQPFALGRLRDIGYRTFHTVWDESYDEITSIPDRFNAIMDLIETLNKREDFLDIMQECEEIVEHNFKMLKLRRPEMSMVKECSTFLKD